MPIVRTLIVFVVISGAVSCFVAGRKSAIRRGFSYPDSPELVEIEEIKISNCLCGVVQNMQGDELDGVLVERLGEQRRERVSAILSDKKGRFHLDQGNTGGDSYLLRFSKPGFNSILVRVRCDAAASDKLIVQLPFSA